MTPRAAARARRRRLYWAALTVFVAGSLFAFFGLPPILKAQAEKRLTQFLDRKVTVGRVRVNPYALSLTVEQFDIRERDGKDSFLGWDRLYVNFEAISFFTGEWRFAAVELAGPHVRVQVNPDGSLNCSDLLAKVSAAGAAPAAPASPAPPARPVRIDRFVLAGARIDFADRSRAAPFTTRFGPVGFTVDHFRTSGGRQAPYQLEAVTETGEKFAWHGWVEAAPFRSSGELSLSGLVLKKYAPYYADKLGVDIADGHLTIRGAYELNLDGKDKRLRLLDGEVRLRSLQLVERSGGATLLDLPALDLTGATADGVTLQAGAKEVVVQGAHLRVRRAADGTLNLLSLLPAAATPAAPAQTVAAPAAPAGPALGLKVGRLALQDCAVDVQDDAVSPGARLGLTRLSASVRNFSLADGTALPVDLAFDWQPRGTLHVGGTVTLKPVKADLQVQADGLALLPLSPYLEQAVRARLAEGQVSVKGAATFEQPGGGAPAATFAGDIWLEKLGLVDAARSEDLAGFSDLIFHGLKIATAPKFSATLSELNLNAPYAHVIVGQDGQLNLASLAGGAKPAAVATPATAPASAPAAAPDLAIARVVINGGKFDFTDRSLSPQVRIGIADFGGTLTDWNSAQPGRGQAELKALVDNVGPVAVTGKFDPLGKNLLVDTQVSLKRVDLVPFSPYAGKYAGYELARGRLALDVKARVADRKIDMSNVVTLDQFTFGAGTNSPDATKLPVRLGVALLKDLDGKIVIDVPVEGSLDDPGFRIGRVVLRVLVNLLTKAAVSPFTLLGSMFGGGGEELGYQEFNPGESALMPAGVAKLETLVKALQARPGLNVGLEGGYDTAADAYALRRLRLDDAIRRAVWEERRVKNPNLPPPDKLEIAPADAAATVKRMFDKQFPPGTTFGTPLPPPPAVQPPPEKAPSSLIGRILAWITFKESRDRKAYEKQQKQTQADYAARSKAAVEAGLPLDQMIGRLAEAIAITPDDLQALAAVRASKVRDYLTVTGKIDPARLYLAAPKPAAEGTTGKGPRVFLTLE